MKLHIFNDPNCVCDALANWIEELIQNVLKENERFTFALSGGSTPKLLYKKLALKTDIEWSKVHFFWGDERTVPYEDERNNAHMAYGELLNKVPVDPKNIHVIRTDVSIEESVIEYNQILHSYFKNGETFDFVLLGMGDDGHTLSLFPDGDLLKDNHNWVCRGAKTGEDIFRITLMPALVNYSKYIAFLVCGNDKSAMLKNVLELDPYYPANLIEPVSDELHWFLDKPAASLLKA